jgi:aryl-alcohol dehydrogenase-like predicted oxidoreductase
MLCRKKYSALLRQSYSAENIATNLALVERIKTIAADKGCTPGQLVLAWLLAQGDDIVPIPGTKRSAQLNENIGALAVRLNAADLAAIERAVPAGAVAGLRYAEAQMKSVYV